MRNPIVVKISWLDPENAGDISLPAYHSAEASGMDVAAAVAEPVELAPGDIKIIPTNLAVAIPPGYEMQVRPRSGLAIKHGVTVINSPGTIDADYRGEVKIGLINISLLFMIRYKPLQFYQERSVELIVYHTYASFPT